jgi:bifunctional non-homologous end joining protein LigD
MAATLTQDRFTGPEWIFKRKLDGIRLLAFKDDRQVRLLSRNRLPQNCPPVADAVANLPVQDVILDGELTWRDSGESRYHVFDILWLNGRDVTPMTLDERRGLLAGLPFRAPIARVLSVEDPVPWEHACREGWEGVIAKRRDSRYEHRRSPHWLKMKCELAQDFVVGGFTDPQGGRVGLGALLVGQFKSRSQQASGIRHQASGKDNLHAGSEFVFAGKVGTGLDTRLLLDLRARLDLLEIPASPFTTALGLPRLRAHWVRPEIVVHVAFIEWTVHGKLRHSRLLDVRS